MLGRRQLRAKAMQALYAYYRSGDDVRKIETTMVKGIQEVYHLYIYLLNLILVFKDLSDQKIETGLRKNFPTPEEANPNRKFSNNKVFKLLSENKTRIAFTKKHNELTWTSLDAYPVKMFKALLESDQYKNYMKSGKDSFSEDKKIILYIVEELIAPNEELQDYLEDLNINWSDDMHIANTMVLKTIQSFNAKCDKDSNLFRLLQSEEHLDYTKELLRETIAHSGQTTKIIEEKANNWELDRIAFMDRIILQMALTEFLHFPSIPPKVTINEYVEISKNYSTPNSKVFVNGILDRTLKELSENGKLKKAGRGLL